jgi:hypothetical protein
MTSAQLIGLFLRPETDDADPLEFFGHMSVGLIIMKRNVVLCLGQSFQDIF